MTRDRAVELACEAITKMCLSHAPAPASHIADAILSGVEEAIAEYRQNAAWEEEEGIY